MVLDGAGEEQDAGDHEQRSGSPFHLAEMAAEALQEAQEALDAKRGRKGTPSPAE